MFQPIDLSIYLSTEKDNKIKNRQMRQHGGDSGRRSGCGGNGGGLQWAEELAEDARELAANESAEKTEEKGGV